MPRSAWVEIRDSGGVLMASIPARIRGGAISADLPAFPPNTRGSIVLCTDEDEPGGEGEREIKDLPTSPSILVVQMG
jgi:hypothetical protein